MKKVAGFFPLLKDDLKTVSLNAYRYIYIIYYMLLLEIEKSSRFYFFQLLKDNLKTVSSNVLGSTEVTVAFFGTPLTFFSQQKGLVTKFDTM